MKKGELTFASIWRSGRDTLPLKTKLLIIQGYVFPLAAGVTFSV